jgi:hypothetical protein
MSALKVAAVSSLRAPATEPPAPLRELLREVVREPPRRISRIIELSLIGAHRCMDGRRAEPHCPLYLALTHGCVADGVALVMTVARGGLPTPIGFINLSSNMAGFYVASTLGIHGPNQAVAADEFSLEVALEFAELGPGHGGQALIGAVEECAWPLAEHRARLGLPPDRALTESSHWLFLDQDCADPVATVQWVRRYADAAVALAALRREPWPAGTQLALSASLQPGAGEWSAATGLAFQPDAADAHSGHWTAYRVGRFIQQRPAPGLLHVSANASGCYATYVTL